MVVVGKRLRKRVDEVTTTLLETEAELKYNTTKAKSTYTKTNINIFLLYSSPKKLMICYNQANLVKSSAQNNWS